VLEENLRGNRVSNATVMRRSLASGAANGRGGVENRHATWGISAPEAANPPLETIDELRLQRLQLLKINETADASFILRGAAATVRRLRPRLFVAVSREEAL
jgi:hypothetical protein